MRDEECVLVEKGEERKCVREKESYMKSDMEREGDGARK